MKNYKGLLFVFVLVFSFTMVLAPVSAQEPEVVLKAGLIDPPSHIDTLATKRLADKVAEKTDGAVKIEVYPSSQLGFAPDMMQGMKAGTVEMFVGAVTWMGAFEKDYWLPGVLYMFDDQETCREIHRGPYFQDLANELREEHGIRVLTQDWDRGARNFISTKPIKEPEDIQDMKIRVPEQESWLKVFELAGANPTPIALAETYTGLQQGVITATEQALNWLYFNKYHTVAKNVSLTKHNYEETGVFISDRVYQNLKPEYQEVIKETAKEITSWHNQKVKEDIANAREEMEAAGVNFIEVDREEWKEYFRSNLPELVEEIGYSQDLVDHVKSKWE